MIEYTIQPAEHGASYVVVGGESILVPTHEIPGGDQAALDAYVTGVVANHLRGERNFQISLTDYLMMPDYPMDDAPRAAWMAYRQVLRDLPDQPGFPFEVEWPERPE